MIELSFPSDTNQQLAQYALEARNVEVRRGPYGTLEIEREELVTNLTLIEDTIGEYGGRIWAD